MRHGCQLGYLSQEMSKSRTYADELVQTKEQTLLVVSLLPRRAMIHRHSSRYLIRLRKVDEPNTHAMVIINHQQTATHNLKQTKIC